MVDIKLPEISENIDAGDVVKVLIAVGDVVAVDQPLIELETEKAVFEVPATSAGTVSEILVSVGGTVKVGQVIVRIDPAGAEASAPARRKADAEPAPPLKAPAAAPAAAEAPAPTAPASKKSASASTPAVNVASAPQKSAGDTPASRPVAPVRGEVVPMPRSGPAAASPSVRRLARELGVDVHAVHGAGPGGRISAEDVQRHVKSLVERGGGAAAAPAAGSSASRPLPDFARYGEVERVRMTKIRQVTAANMASAWRTVPAVTQNDEADITEIEAARKKYAKLAEEAGGKLTMTAILLKLCAGALRRFPEFNASIDAAASEVVYKKYVHVAVAVDTEHGLLVPVIRDVDGKSIVELSAELAGVAQRARDRKLPPAEMEGACFTISNLGGIGGTSFSPIVNTPEVAILGVSRARMQPVWKDDGFEPRLMMPLSLSYDHRLIDGASAARFTRWLCEALENPILLALDA